MKKRTSAQAEVKLMQQAAEFGQPAPPETNNLTALAGQIPAEILLQVAKAVRSGKCLIAVWRIEDMQLLLDRTTIAFPIADFSGAIKLLQKDLNITE